MKRYPAVFLAVILFAAFAQSQRPTSGQVDEPQQLSAYMRDVGLLYIETVEGAVETIGDGRYEKAFAAAKMLDDRIEIHVERPADKEFYELGLLRLKGAGHIVAKMIDNSIAGRDFADMLKLYMDCDSDLRGMIKVGEYRSDTLTRACTVQRYKADTAQNPLGPIQQQAIANTEASTTSPAAAAAVANAGRELSAQELSDLVQKGEASRCGVVTKPAGAEVYIDGNKAGISPMAFVLVKHGSTARLVTIKMSGYKTVEQAIIPDGKVVPIAVTLEKLP